MQVEQQNVNAKVKQESNLGTKYTKNKNRILQSLFSPAVYVCGFWAACSAERNTLQQIQDSDYIRPHEALRYLRSF